MIKRLIGVLVVGVAVVCGLSPFMFGPGQEEHLTVRGPVQMIGVSPLDKRAICLWGGMWRK